jgi:hypothetical protein
MMGSGAEEMPEFTGNADMPSMAVTGFVGPEKGEEFAELTPLASKSSAVENANIMNTVVFLMAHPAMEFSLSLRLETENIKGTPRIGRGLR